MNEQGLADRFSQQVDHLLGGEPPTVSPGDEGLRELLSLAEELARVGFQASPAAQAAFQGQLERWSGPTNGPRTPVTKFGRRNIMSGKLLAVIISILVTVTSGAIAVVVAILVVIRGGIPAVPASTPTPTLTDTPSITTTVSPSPSVTSTMVPTETVTATVVPSPTITGTVDTIDTITVVVTIEIDIGDLVPGLPPGDGGDDDDDGDGDHHDDDYHDHNRGHGNDPDHHDEDNPGRGHH